MRAVSRLASFGLALLYLFGAPASAQQPETALEDRQGWPVLIEDTEFNNRPNSEGATGTAVDPRDGGVVVIGFYRRGATSGEGKVFFGPATPDETVTIGEGGTKAFVARYGPAGQLVWMKDVADAEIHDVAIDAAGNAFVVGYYEGVLSLGSVTLFEPNIDEQAVQYFIAKIDPDGEWVWASGSDARTFKNLCSHDGDTDSQIVCTGQIQTRFRRDFNNGPFLHVALDGSGAPHVAGSFKGVLHTPHAPEEERQNTRVRPGHGYDFDSDDGEGPARTGSLASVGNTYINTREYSWSSGCRPYRGFIPGISGQNLWNGGGTRDDCGFDIFVERYDAINGDPVWILTGGTSAHDSEGQGGDTDRTARTGTLNRNFHYAFSHFGNANSEIFQNSDQVATDLVVGADGSIYVAGRAYPSEFGPRNMETFSNIATNGRFTLLRGTPLEKISHIYASPDPVLDFAADFVAKLRPTTLEDDTVEPLWWWLAMISTPLDDFNSEAFSDTRNPGPHLAWSQGGLYVASSVRATGSSWNVAGAKLLDTRCRGSRTRTDCTENGDGTSFFPPHERAGAQDQAWALLARLDDEGLEATWSLQAIIGTPVAGQNLSVSRLAASGDAVLLAGSGTAEIRQPVFYPQPFVPGAEDGAEGAWFARWDGGDFSWFESIGDAGPSLSRIEGLVLDAGGKATIVGEFEGETEFGDRDPDAQTLDGRGGDLFVTQLDGGGNWAVLDTWTLGEVVAPPEGSDPSTMPEIEVDGVPASEAAGFFYWSNSEDKLYAIRPTQTCTGDDAERICEAIDGEGGIPLTVRLRWRVPGGSAESRLVQTGGVVPPDLGSPDTGAEAATRSVVQGAPLDLADPFSGAVVTPVRVVFSEGAAQLQGASFTSDLGYSVVLFVDGTEPDEFSNPVRLVVVKTTKASLALADLQSCTIGETIFDAAAHTQTGTTGFVLRQVEVDTAIEGPAPVDAEGEDRAYDPETRTGSIVAVNTGPFGVVWYNDGGHTLRGYDCQWPTDAPVLVVASTLGSERLTDGEGDDPAGIPGGELVLSALEYPDAHVYSQPDPDGFGYNPNDEHAFLAPSNLCATLGPEAAAPRCPEGATDSSRSDALFALRGTPTLPDAYVLLKSGDGADGWKLDVFRVQQEDPAANASFRYAAVAAERIFPPYPLSLFPACSETRAVAGAREYFLDVNGQSWARSDDDTDLVLEYFYPLQEGFSDEAAELGDCIAFGPPEDPFDVLYDVTWPAAVPKLHVGETLIRAKEDEDGNGLPSILTQAAVEVVYEAAAGSVLLFDPLSDRTASLPILPSEVQTKSDGPLQAFSDPKLPLDLAPRVFHDPSAGTLIVRGFLEPLPVLGDPLLLPNVLSTADRDDLIALSSDEAYQAAVNEVYCRSRQPAVWDGLDTECDVVLGFEPDPEQLPLVVPRPFTGLINSQVLTAGSASGTGYVTIAFNNDEVVAEAGNPISLQVIEVVCDPYQGQLKLLPSDNLFDERFTLRHSGDFGGDPERYEFEWFVQADVDGIPPPPPVVDPVTGSVTPGAWTRIAGENQVRFTLDSADDPRRALVDNWFFAHAREATSGPVCPTVPGGLTAKWSALAGSPGGTEAAPEAQLAEGWVKRVVLGLNAFEARVKDFHASATDTFASLLVAAGRRYTGDIALNPDPQNLNEVGLIEAYTTVSNRARDLTIEAEPPLVGYSPGNSALLLAAGRIADLYMLLGNEAFADAADPTIGFTSASGEVGTLAPAIFSFQNQLDSLLTEELVLLRGRDDSLSNVTTPPIYNRLIPNFTSGQGELAYVQNYNISDQPIGGAPNGVIDELDALVLFPQGHGDAWGHYLTAIKSYYELLRDPAFDWEPRGESVSVAQAPVPVDFLDERKFARAAAMRARTGAEIVDLTYRKEYVEDPAGQWQGYKDPDPQRAWGLAGTARRAGKGAYYDWVVANSILPAEDVDPTHTGIRKIDRTTVPELSEIIAAYTDVQQQLDEADRGLNPLGLAKGVVPFDIDPSRIDAGETHFEQVHERAVKALGNAVAVFDYANELTNRLRENQDSVDDFSNAVAESERDFGNRLIELFGTPFPDDIGPTGTYPNGYEGPDLFHYAYVDPPPLREPRDRVGDDFVQTVQFNVEGFEGFEDATLTVDYNASLDGFGLVKPADWTRPRRAPGELQLRLSELVEAESELAAAGRRYDDLIAEVLALAENGKAQQELDDYVVSRTTGAQVAEFTLQTVIDVATTAKLATDRFGEEGRAAAEAADKCLPSFVGSLVAPVPDPSQPGRCAIRQLSNIQAAALRAATSTFETGISAAESSKSLLANALSLDILIAQNDSEVKSPELLLLTSKIREEPGLRLEIEQRAEIVARAQRNYRSSLARGIRLLDERAAFRKTTAASVQDARYRDVSFRVFRNDAIQKLRAAYDLTARYAFLAATAYDYETSLLRDQNGSGQEFLTDIVKQRALGQVIGGQPVPGSRGLADPLARLALNFDVQKGQLGFNNPQTETNRFSLRREHFRQGESSDCAWVDTLDGHRVDDLFEVPEFRRFARPFAAPDPNLPQPGLVIPFDTTVTAGRNFFGERLGPGDSAYDATNFATKVRSVGVWFDGYDELPLSNTPRVYLIPVGFDVLRSPEADDFNTREWVVADQAIPVPFPIGALDLEDPAWVPSADSLSEPQGTLRRFSSFRAFDLEGEFDPQQTTSDSRLIGRSVWNSRWLLIIPGQNLLFDPAEGVETLVHGEADGGACDPNAPQIGIRDIQLFFQTYSYSGN